MKNRNKTTFKSLANREVGKRTTVEKKLRLSGLKTTKIMHEWKKTMVKWIKNYKKYARVKINYGENWLWNLSKSEKKLLVSGKKNMVKWKKNYGWVEIKLRL